MASDNPVLLYVVSMDVRPVPNDSITKKEGRKKKEDNWMFDITVTL